jgi:hypothetical protein
VIDTLGQLTGAQFQATLRYWLRELQPVLVIIDPLYAYVGGDVEAGNLYQMGPVLNAAAALTDLAGVSLKIAHHTTKQAAKKHPTLTDITQAGAREWCSAWVLLSHHEPPDLDEQSFKLRLSVGGRLGYGSAHELDVRLGPVAEDSIRRAERITYELRSAVEAAEQSDDEAKSARILATLHTFEKMAPTHAKAFAKRIKVSDKTGKRRLDELVEAGHAATSKSGRVTMYDLAETDTDNP